MQAVWGALFTLGKMNYWGKGVAKDVQKALHFIETAANHGHLPSSLFLGAVHELSKDVPKDDTKAHYFFQLAVNQHGDHGDASDIGHAHFSLFRLHMEEDPHKAIEHCLHAAKLSYLVFLRHSNFCLRLA